MRLLCSRALLPDGWAADVLVEIGDDGRIATVTPGADAEGAEPVRGIAIPGMPNLHSHAFQRALVGRTQRRGPGDDTFWTWREAMYRLVAALTPESVRAIAAQAYVEMLKGGYSSVAEFHYQHNRPDGSRYDAPGEMSRAVAGAAQEAGIRMTLLPVLYQDGGFGGVPAADAQRRFVLPTEAYLKLIEDARLRCRDSRAMRVGMALHSLRAVAPDALRDAVAGYAAIDPQGPIHIHVAEQVREVEECQRHLSARPVEWLLGNAEIDRRWTLVHATHMTMAETRDLARSGAVAGLCPSTEADLGDGLFPLPAYLASGGAFGIGSDSNLCLDPAEELRWLEYGQRLDRRERNVAAGSAGNSTGAALWRAAAAGGAQALGQPVGRLSSGAAADIVVLDPEHPALLGRDGDEVLDALIFGPAGGAVRDVMVAGDWVVRDGTHGREAAILTNFKAAMKAIGAAI